MKKRKYIIVKHSSGILAPILFPEYIEHADMARGFKAVSAGTVTFDENGEPSVSGYSHSLKLYPGKDDAETIKYAGGYE